MVALTATLGLPYELKPSFSQSLHYFDCYSSSLKYVFFFLKFGGSVWF